MKNSFRRILLALVMACFILTATNVVLVLHLAEHHKDEHHDSEHCPICQQAIVNTVKAILPDAPVIKEPPRAAATVVCVIQSLVKDFKFLTPHTRAPPAVS
ncbi:MAG: hypothetical protein PHQ35_03650 [Phycisphaerae bacterium]|nr:hypothetical protein [Phycisphaerae bacterium]MDD5380613.1 hypothetical protein [Phycisphaerae bacterium]